MGLSQSRYIFCRHTDKAVQGLSGVHKQINDCLAAGRSRGQLESRLEGLFDTCRLHNIKISKRKFKIWRSLEFGGFQIDGSGEDLKVGPAPSRIKAVMAIETPSTKRQVREFLCLASTLEAWTPSISMSPKLLRNLAWKDVKFRWSPELEVEFRR